MWKNNAGLCRTVLMSAAVVAAVPVMGEAAVIPISGNTADAAPRSNNSVIDATNATFFVGHGSDNNVGSPVFVFQLPALPAGEGVTSAVFDGRYSADDSEDLRVDLYALAVRSSATVLASDFGEGETPAGPVGQTKIADDFVTGSTSQGRLTTNASQSLVLGGFLAANYSAGEYLFVRLTPVNPDRDGTNDRYRFNTANDPDLGDQPILTLTTAEAVVPEPTSFALAAAGAGLLMVRRRR
ncbi:MAG TPA: PEP-CTERM sorting domain-containing protein [Tepidisphaeraceae bacterium]|nr:PEP-CTERM sorting domain-containing protein [Tepidisphaeraceae bacterium]